MTKTILTIAILFAALTVSACNTVEGAGTDIQNLGTGMKKVAN